MLKYFNNLILLISFSLLIINCSNKYVPAVNIIKITASSILDSDKSAKYYPHNILQTIKNTSIPWVEGKNDSGIGEFIEIFFEDNIVVNRLSFINGYNDPKWYHKNNRVKEIKISLSNNEYTYTLKDTMKRQFIDLSDYVKTKYIKITIISIYKGDSFDDTCLSSIEFYFNDRKIKYNSIPKYNICSFESRIHASIDCPPGGDPLFLFTSEGNVIYKKMKVYGFADKGYYEKSGIYIIDMSTLAKRKVIGGFRSTGNNDVKELWTVKLMMCFPPSEDDTHVWLVEETWKDHKVIGAINICGNLGQYDFAK